MSKDASYHQSAIQYNEEFATFAADLAERVEHPEVKKWCRSIAKQHDFHAGRHHKALQKMEARGTDETPQPQDDDPTDTPAPVDPSPAATPVESEPNPEQAAEPADAGVGTPVTGPDEAIFVNERTELEFHEAVENDKKQMQEQIA